MMEYTVARVVTIMCGALLIASVLPPVQSLFDDGESAGLQEQSVRICMMIDTFYDSEADEMVLSLNTVLPKGTTLSMNGHLVTVSADGSEYISDTVHEIVSDSDRYWVNDILRFTRDDGKVMIESI